MLFLRTLGGLALENGGQPIAGAAGQRGRLAILAVLAVGGERGVSRDRLLAMFWPESDDERARGALKQALYALRRDSREQELTIGTSTLRLNPDVIRTDVGEFESHIRAGAFEKAVALYAGPFLEGVYIKDARDFERWTDVERRRLADAYQGALESLVQSETARGDFPSAFAFRRRLALADPLSSRFAHGYMQALVAIGDREAAIRHGREFVDLTQEELGVAPDTQVVQLIEELRRTTGMARTSSQAPIAPVRAAATALSETAVVIPERHRYVRLAAIATLGAAAVAVGAVLAFTSPSYSVGAARRVTADRELEAEVAISPDGRFIAFVAGGRSKRIFVRAIDGTRVITLTGDREGEPHWPQWSPDGTQLTYVRYDSGVYIIPAFGGPRKHVVFDKGVSGASWSRDGRSLVYSDIGGAGSPYARPGRIWTLRLAGGAPQLVVTAVAPHSPSFSPDGQRILYGTGNPGPGSLAFGAVGHIWVVSREGGEPARISDSGSVNSSPSWLPDGERIVFVSNRGGFPDVYAQRLRSGALQRGEPVRLTAGSSVRNVSVSADGRRLAYATQIRVANIWRVPILADRFTPDSLARPVTSEQQDVEGVSISSDGKWLIYDSDRNGNRDIYRMPVDGGEPERITTHPASDMQPVPSLDNDQIVFYSMRNGSRDVYVINSDGTGEQQVTSDPYQEYFPTWSPDRQHIAFVSNRTGRMELYVVDRLASGKWSEWRRMTHTPGVQNFFARWSPDGRHIAVQRGLGISLVDPRSGSIRHLLDSIPDKGVPWSPQWSRDAVTIFFQTLNDRGEYGYWSVPSAGGKPRLLYQFKDSLPFARVVPIASDGKSLFFTRAGDEADLWVMELNRIRAGLRP